MDHLSKQSRSALMSRVRRSGTAPELTVRRLVYSMGFRYRLCVAGLPGRPDLVFRSRRKVIFVHGCFWHRHTCPRGKPPLSNSEYWIPKLDANVKRDRKVQEELESTGWKVLVIWACETRDLENLRARIEVFLRS
ncbi:very short patch repair endonuclease [Pandoraea morbifera]|uniref:very short patch repair endonuclease n=1 Tax=Pandoraea morbifera TaxID=2508300 RepID=UPI0012400017|nr:very short patch repair endonuclease [Pandoraea morbifera]